MRALPKRTKSANLGLALLNLSEVTVLEKMENKAEVLVFPVWLNTVVTCTVCGGDKVLSKEDAPKVKHCGGSTYYFSCEKCGTDTHFRK